MRSHSTLFGCALLITAGLARLGSSADGAMDALFTADLEGRMLPLPDGSGGFARFATVVSGIRSEAPAVILVDCGNALFGADSLQSGGRGPGAACAALRYDAINVSFRDFRRGKAATISLLNEARLPAISANLLDADSGKALFQPYKVLNAGGKRVAILGITEAPVASLDSLPRLREELAGVRIAPALEAVAEELPKARAESDRIVLAYYGNARGLRRILEKHGGSFALVCVGSLRSDLLPQTSSAPLAAVESAGAGLARVSWKGSAGESKPEIRQIAVEASTRADPAVEAIVREHVKANGDPLAEIEDAASDSTRAGIPSELEPDKEVRLDVTGANRGARLTVLTATLSRSYGSIEAPPGRRMMVLATRWQNVIPLTAVKDQKVPTEYRIPHLEDHLYLVVDGTRVERLRKNADELPGHLPTSPFKLERLGTTTEGNVIYEVPETGIQSLELRFYDFAHGPITLELVQQKDPADAALPKPIAPPQKNEFVEAAAYAFEKPSMVGGRAAPPGSRFVRVDLRARSLATIDGDATAFDPKAKPGARIQIGTVADWKESRRYLQLVVDGEIACAPLPESALAEEPRFLPDLPTGGEILFSVPEESLSLELRCDFPNAKSSADAKILRPRGLTIPLEGQRPRLAPVQGLVSVVDDAFVVTVISQSLAEEIRGARAEAAERLWVIGVTVENRGTKGEHFQPIEQISCALSDGKQTPMDPVSASGPRAPLPLIWIPQGERRSFQAVFRIPVNEKRPRLKYAGVSLAKVLELPETDLASAAGATPGAATTPPGASPPARPVDPAQKVDPATDAAKATSKPATPPARVETKPPAVAARKPAFPEPTAELLKPPRAAAGLPGVGLTAEQVNESIDRGAAFLWSHVKEKDLKLRRLQFGDDNSHCLVALALVHAGLHKKDAEFDLRLRGYLATIDATRLQMYPAGITSMLVEAYGDPAYLDTLRKAVRYMLEVQGPLGSWTYSRPIKDGAFSDPNADRVFLISGGVPLDGSAGLAPLPRLTPWKDGLDGDNSVSQYAILGLHAATSSGVSIAAESWTRALASYRSRQGDDGNWTYNGKSFAGYGSMTCAGVCAVAIALHELGEKTPASDPTVLRGLAWLDRNFSVTKHPGMSPPERWRFYYLYSLERVGRVLGLDFIGKHEWYPAGAKHLLETQRPEGGWIGKFEEEDPRLATSFALLFLTRATTQLTAQGVRRGGDGTLRTGIQLPRASRYYFILDASGSMIADMGGKTKWEIARDSVSRLIEELPETCEVGLRVYGHRKRATEPDASDDTALEMPLRKLDRKAMLAKIAALRPKGKTPLARSLLEAKRDLQGFAATGNVTVVLLTDGGEDTQPRQDPVKAAAELGTLRGVRLSVVGFDIGRDDWSAQLRAIAERGEGTYWPAKGASDLFQDLRSAVFGVPSGFVVLDEAGKESARGGFGQSIQLHEGRYLMRTSYAGEDFEDLFWINTDAKTSVVFNAARIAARAPVAGKRPAGEAPVKAQPKADEPPPPAAVARFCSECGGPLKPEAKFCPGCGVKVKS